MTAAAETQDRAPQAAPSADDDGAPRARGARAGLVLTGGGARAAYQVGVLKAVSELLGAPKANPFPILCGTSAGAVNATSLAARADDFAGAVDGLVTAWEAMRCERIYRTDVANVMRNGARWLAAMMLLTRRNPVSLLDNSPLLETIGRLLRFEDIQAHIDAGRLYAVCVTASGYTSGQSVSFYEYFGDGSMRQIAPVSPALHLGADRVFIVGTGRQNDDTTRARSSVYPSLAQIAGHALNSIFLDTLMVDLERLERINRTLSAVPQEALSSGRIGLRPVKVLFLSPSHSIERIAVRFLHELPRTVRFILRPTGALNRSGSNLASYLLFEEGFCRALIDLGYQDTMSRSDDVRAFFEDQ